MAFKDPVIEVTVKHLGRREGAGSAGDSGGPVCKAHLAYGLLVEGIGNALNLLEADLLIRR